MFTRLREGMKITDPEVAGICFSRDPDGQNIIIRDRMPAFEEEELDVLLDEVAEIKKYLFCRLLCGSIPLKRSSVTQKLPVQIYAISA